jgi:PAS domain S-box-containing protein
VSELNNVELSVWDKTNQESVLLHDYFSEYDKGKHTREFKKEYLLDFGSRRWVLDFVGDNDFGASSFEKNFPLAVLIFGTVLDLLTVAAFYLFLTLQSQKVKESEDKFKAIVDVARDAIIMMDGQGQTVLWNKAAEEMFGYTFAEVNGKKFHQLIATTPEHTKEENILKFGQTGESAVLGKTLELPAKKKDGTQIVMELTVARVKIGSQWFAVGVARDVTAKKKVAEELASHAQELERSNRLMVDRELKMVELKKEIDTLKKGQTNENSH